MVEYLVFRLQITEHPFFFGEGIGINCRCRSKWKYKPHMESGRCRLFQGLKGCVCALRHAIIVGYKRTYSKEFFKP